MAGHSKWANIKHRKNANDLKKAQYFTKLIKEIIAAVKQGGSIPDTNPRLRLAIQNAKEANMPKDNIDRAISKGSRAEDTGYTTVTYEGNASHGVAAIVACMTDNLNRTVASVRATFSKYGGSLGRNGSVAFLFDRKGVFTIKSEAIEDEEALTMMLIDAGAEAREAEEGYLHITCSLENFGSLQKQLEGLAIEPIVASLQYIPHTQVELEDQTFIKVMALIEALEGNDDVQKVYHNIAMNDRQLQLL